MSPLLVGVSVDVSFWSAISVHIAVWMRKADSSTFIKASLSERFLYTVSLRVMPSTVAVAVVVVKFGS